MKQPFIITFLSGGSSWDEPVSQGKSSIILADTIEEVLRDPFIQNSGEWNGEGTTVEVQPMKRNHATLFLPEEPINFSYDQVLLHREIYEPEEVEDYYARIASNLPSEK